MTTYDKEIVLALRARLADRIGADKYAVWFTGNVEFHAVDERLEVVVGDRFFQDWLRSNFREALSEAATEVFGKTMSVEFRVDASVRDVKRPTRPSVPATAAPCVTTGSKPCAGNPARRRPATLGEFVVGDSNKLALAAAQLAVTQPGRISPIVVCGPTGVGKTHLLEGICAAHRQPHGSAAIYLTAEQFTSYFVEALHGGGMPLFRRKYRDLGLLAIDDVQFFANKRAAIGELIHTIDGVSRRGGQLVFACTDAPSAIKGLGADLAARLSAGSLNRIDAPEFPTRLGIVRQLAARLQVSLPDDVAEYVAANFTNHARELAGAIKRLETSCVALDRPISLALAQESLMDLVAATAQPMRLVDIQRAVCEEFGLELASLMSDRKEKSVSHPRMLAMWLARKHTRAALSEIGRCFGGRSHSTVVAAQKRIDNWIVRGGSLHLAGQTYALSDAIRRVQQRLKLA